MLEMAQQKCWFWRRHGFKLIYDLKLDDNMMRKIIIIIIIIIVNIAAKWLHVSYVR